MKISAQILDSIIKSVVIIDSPASLGLDMGSYAARLLLSKLSWAGVRQLGNLQILTKASYWTAALVPLIAAIWPAIRGTANKFNESVRESVNFIDEARSELNSVVSSTDVHTMEVLETLNKSISSIVDNFAYLRHDVSLPDAFVLAFFASLLTIIAHLIYQIACPDEIKVSNLDEFVDRKVRLLESGKSQIDFNHMLDYLSGKSGISKAEIYKGLVSGDVSAAAIYEKILQKSDLNFDSAEIKATLTMMGAYFTIERNNDAILGDINKDEESVVRIDEFMEQSRFSLGSVADLWARTKYADLLKTRAGSALLAALMYFLAILLVAVIVVQQTISVLRAASWI